MNTHWIKIAHSAWDLDQEAELRNLKALDFEPTTNPPSIKIIPEADFIEIEVKRGEPG